ncbi:MAG: hypothetical protein JO019_04995 [Candidatus Kaiserbacteria bacterium]|nr:hypothetical protein [Candidatus Kaiserbacteria bacterium]
MNKLATFEMKKSKQAAGSLRGANVVVGSWTKRQVGRKAHYTAQHGVIEGTKQ